MSITRLVCQVSELVHSDACPRPMSGDNCDGTVTTYGATQHEGQTCLIMDLYEGSLDDKLESDGKLSLSATYDYCGQILAALTSLHKHGAAVLDLKPANLLFKGEKVYISDFGISSVAGMTLTSQTKEPGSATGGTLAYMAPEQHDPATYGKPGTAADMWAWGCVVLELWTGEGVWKGKTPSEILTEVLIKKRHPEIPAGLPPTLVAILERCFCTDAAQRIRSGPTRGG